MSCSAHFITPHVVNPCLAKEKSIAVRIMEARLDKRTHVSQSSAPEQSKTKAADSDAASVSSFGSSVGLLKSKFHLSSTTGKKKESSSSSSSASSMQRKALRKQVNMVG
jgi:hypothetical protein